MLQKKQREYEMIGLLIFDQMARIQNAVLSQARDAQTE